MFARATAALCPPIRALVFFVAFAGIAVTATKSYAQLTVDGQFQKIPSPPPNPDLYYVRGFGTITTSAGATAYSRADALKVPGFLGVPSLGRCCPTPPVGVAP